MAGVALGNIDLHFAWPAWHLLYGTGLALVARLVPIFRRGRRGCLSGRCSIWKHRPAFCVAGVALGDIDLHFVWHAWHLLYGTGLALVARLVPIFRRGRRGCLSGRCSIWKHRPAFCVAGVALGDIDLHFVWHAWHLLYGTGLALVARLVPIFRRGRRGCLSGRCSIWKHRPAFCVAGVALGDIDLHFVWHAWHLLYGTGLALVARLVPVCRHGRRGCLCGRRGIWKHRPHSVWQVWHLATSTIYLTHRAKRQSSASAKNLLQAVRSHDGLRGLLAHIAYAAKTNGCHSPLFMVLARRLWLHNMITRHLSTTFVDIQHFNSHYVLTPHLCTHTSVPHNSFTHNSLTHTFPRMPCTHNTFTPTPVHTAHSPTALSHTTHDSFTHTTFTPYLDTHFFHQQHFQLITRNSFTHLTSTRISCTHRSSTISFLFPAFPIPFSPFFGYLLEEVDMWGFSGPLMSD